MPSGRRSDPLQNPFFPTSRTVVEGGRRCKRIPSELRTVVRDFAVLQRRCAAVWALNFKDLGAVCVALFSFLMTQVYVRKQARMPQPVRSAGQRTGALSHARE